MITRIQRWGNSQGIRIPKNILENSCIKVGEEVELFLRDGKIIIEPTNKIHGKYRISELVEKISPEYYPSEEDWGNAVGKEEW